MNGFAMVWTDIIASILNWLASKRCCGGWIPAKLMYLLWHIHSVIIKLQRWIKRERMTSMSIEKVPQPKKRTLLLSEKISQSSVKKMIEEIFAEEDVYVRSNFGRYHWQSL